MLFCVLESQRGRGQGSVRRRRARPSRDCLHVIRSLLLEFCTKMFFHECKRSGIRGTLFQLLSW